jgi:HK97 family phage major capsid protein
MSAKIADLRARKATALDALHAKRKAAFDKLKSLGDKPDFSKAIDQPEFDRLKAELVGIDIHIKSTDTEYETEIKRAQDVQDFARAGALPVAGQERALPAEAREDKDAAWTSEKAAERMGLGTCKGLIVGGIAKALLMGSAFGSPVAAAKAHYGEHHPVTLAVEKALVAGVGGSGGFIVPPEYVNEIIELLRPRAVVRSANPRVLPMPRGTMTLPAQTAAAAASYGAENTQITASQQTLGQIVATYKKLTALVPVGNDLMRYANPAADAFVRDDLVKIIALREDLAFLIGDGAADSPRGFTSFANSWAVNWGGAAGNWLSTAASTMAVNGTSNPATTTGGNFITSNSAYTLATVAQELGGAVNRLDTANVPDIRRRWFMHPRSWNYLNNVQNSLGVYVYRDELGKGALLSYPFSKSTQIPINIWDATATNKDLSFVMLVEMDDALLLDSMSLELAVSREGTYYDSNSVLQSAFQKDQTLIRAIAEHDFQMRHAAAIAVIQAARWAPAIS